MGKQFQEDQKGKRFYRIDSYPLNGIYLYNENYYLSDDFRGFLATQNLQGRSYGDRRLCAPCRYGLRALTEAPENFSRIHATQCERSLSSKDRIFALRGLNACNFK